MYIYLITRVAICREAHKNRGTDRELVGLAKYLTLIAKLDDFSNLRWKYSIYWVKKLDDDIIVIRVKI